MPFVSSVRGSYGGQGQVFNRYPFAVDGSTSSTGGTITTAGGYRIHTFTSTGNTTFTLVSASVNGTRYPLGGLNTGLSTNVEYLVVAGGGSGGRNANICSGGGAGGMRTGTLSSPATSYTITVGSGGTGPAATPGGNSVFSSITSTGGGRGNLGESGGDPATNGGGPGGSGGGQAYNNSTAVNAAGTPGQGNPGGSGAAQTSVHSSGGGGGAGGAGQNGSNPLGRGGNGGAGVSSSISGSPLNYAGGGGGGSWDSGGIASGGSGVGGNGGGGSNIGSSTDGTPGRGGGGGGGYNNSNSKSGGSGVVILRYLV
jgi:hypothetical protein